MVNPIHHHICSNKHLYATGGNLQQSISLFLFVHELNNYDRKKKGSSKFFVNVIVEKLFEFVSKPEQPGLSSSIRLEVVYI